MKPNQNGEKELFGTVQPYADAEFVYALHIDIIVNYMLPSDVDEFGHILDVNIGNALKKLCPDSQQCDNDGPCESYSCKFARFIFECSYRVIGHDLREKLTSFTKMYVRRLQEQTPFLVDYQIRNTVENSQPDENYDE